MVCRARGAPLKLGALIVLAAALPPIAQAHPQYSAAKSNCYLKLSLSGGGAVRVAWSLLVGEIPSLAVRRGADANGDGHVDERELAGYAAEVARAVADGLVIEVDGERRAVRWEEPVVGLSDRRVGPLPFAVDLVGRLPVPGAGPHRVRLDDRTAVDRVGGDLGESEIRVEEGPGTRMLAAWQGREDGGRVLRFVWNGPRFSVLEDRSIGFRFVDEQAKRTARVHRLRAPVALVGGLAAAGIAAVLTMRHTRRRSRERRSS